MALTTVNVLNNSASGGVAALTNAQDMLIAGPQQLVSQPIAVASGQGILQRGTVLGRVTASGKYIVSLAGAVDGSQTPVAILADIADATSADALSGAYFSGEFYQRALTFDVSWTIATLTQAMKPYGVFLKSASTALSNADAT